MKYYKTTISRNKLYQRNYLRDRQEIVFVEDTRANINMESAALIEILFSKYMDGLS